MFQYTWMCLHNTEYDWICRHILEKKNRVPNMPEFWMSLMQYIVYGHCTNYWAVIETETYSEHCQTFKTERSAKIIIPECTCATRNFSGQWKRGALVELGHFDKHFVKNKKKKPHRETFLSFFYQFYIFTNFKPNMNTIRAFLLVFKKDRGDLLSLPYSCAPVSDWIRINIPEYA